jgi:hypothetical protein
VVPNASGAVRVWDTVRMLPSPVAAWSASRPVAEVRLAAETARAGCRLDWLGTYLI